MESGNMDIGRRQLLGAAALTAAAPALAQVAPDLKGRSVLITGTSSGFGRLAALHLARQGATVVASMRNLQGGRRPEAVSLLAEGKGLPIRLVEIDVVDPASVMRGVAEAERIAGGALDAVISNAGIGIGGPVELHDEEALSVEFGTNLFGGLRVARAALPAMRKRRQGLIIPVSSQLGRFVLPGIGSYCGTKFALEAMFETMAYELAPFGVEVSIVQPGGYPTRIWQSGRQRFDALVARLDAERRRAYAQQIEMTRRFFDAPRDTDPMDVPRAFAELIALPSGKRPLRRPVAANGQAVEAANKALAQIQAAVLGRGSFAPWHAAVTD